MGQDKVKILTTEPFSVWWAKMSKRGIDELRPLSLKAEQQLKALLKQPTNPQSKKGVK